jgi:hypothetical protein
MYSKKIFAQFLKKLAGGVPGVPALLPGPRPFYFLFNQCNVFEIIIRTILKKNLACGVPGGELCTNIFK